MRKIAIAVLATALVAMATAPAFAAVLMSEGFSYANGNLVPNGGWANFSGAATDVQVVAGRAVGSGPNANDDHRLFAAQPTTSKTYACFEVMIPAVAAAPKPIYFAMLKDAGTSIFVSRVYVLALSSGGWTFGISHTSTSATAGVTPWTAALSYDVSYRVVINYDPVAKSSTLWVNPSNELSSSVTNTLATATAVAVAGFGLRQSATSATLPASPSYAGTADWGFSVDNLGVGTTFDDACAQLTPARTTTWGRVKTLYR
jgi:disulfide bond formation protein DsbB